MNLIGVMHNHSRGSNFRKGPLALGLLVVLISCSAVALDEKSKQPTTSDFSIHATHVIGFEGTPNNTNGTIIVKNDALQFEKAQASTAEIKITSVRSIFLGDQSEEVGGLPMTLGKAAVPFGGGRAVSLFAHKDYDLLTLEYVDRNGGIHGAIFQLKKGQGEVLRRELVTRGAQASADKNASETQSTAEVPSESK